MKNQPNVLEVIDQTSSEKNQVIYASGLMKVWQVQKAAKDFMIAQVMKRYN